MPLWNLPESVHAGKIIKPHSYLGDVKVAFFYPSLEEVIVPGKFVFVAFNGKPVPFRIERIKFIDDETALMKLEGIGNDEEARKLSDRDVILPEEDIPEEESDAEPEIIGYKVKDMEGNSLGKVYDLIDNGPQSLLEVIKDVGGTFLIPVHEDLIRGINNRKKEITVDLPEGLIDLE